MSASRQPPPGRIMPQAKATGPQTVATQARPGGRPVVVQPFGIAALAIGGLAALYTAYRYRQPLARLWYPGTEYATHLPGNVGNELGEAALHHVQRVRVGTIQFDQLLASRDPMKYIVDLNGFAWVVPLPTDIKHTVASLGGNVKAAGYLAWAYNKVKDVNQLILDNWSGHYHPAQQAVSTWGLSAVNWYGYWPAVFDDKVHTPNHNPAKRYVNPRWRFWQ